MPKVTQRQGSNSGSLALGSDPSHFVPLALHRVKLKGKILEGDRDAILHRVFREGFPEEVTMSRNLKEGR